ncbi:unnamed protein product [Cuscuta epithymum]|uniref:Uncharacterized protein n=1 Tax=Cuscuta epithymum TaxID=186058 RepID=A0AAV0CNC7_9ASTE|nr:unnamed protein product [Cuscuta epithymum]
MNYKTELLQGLETWDIRKISELPHIFELGSKIYYIQGSSNFQYGGESGSFISLEKKRRADNTDRGHGHACTGHPRRHLNFYQRKENASINRDGNHIVSRSKHVIPSNPSYGLS